MEQKTLGEVAKEDYWAHDGDQWWEAVAQAVVAEYERRRWRPISEAHEDFSVCLFVNMRDPGTYHAGTVLDDNWAEMAEEQGWTHFTPVLLTNETAEALLAELPAGPEVGNVS